MRKSRMNRRYSVFKNICRVIILLFVLWPIFWGFRTSIMENQYENSFFPTEISFASYLDLFQSRLTWLTFRNSIVSGLGTLAILLPVVILGAYALARIPFKGRRLGKLFIYLPLVPSIALLVNLGTIINKLHLMNNLFAVILLNVAFLSPFTLWMLRNFMMTISYSLEEAAKLDGCGRFRSLIYVILPSAAPGVITVTVYTFIQSWLNFMFGYTAITDEKLMLVPQRVSSFLGMYTADLPQLCAYSIIALIPPLLFFIIFQKWFIAGLFGNLSK